MPFNEIGNIQIMGNNQGMAYGGHIYSANISIGNSASPTKLTINVVHKNGVPKKAKDGIRKDIDELNKISIAIGDMDKIFMHLVSYQIRKNVGSNVLSLEYVDGSILLDKIQVCLAERQYAKENQNSLYSNETGSIKDSESSFTLTVKCQTCENDSVLKDKTATLKRDVKYASSEEDPFFFVPSNAGVFNSEGGLLILGRENFVENSCDVPEVDYTFTDLIKALSSKYVTIKDKSLKDRTIDSTGYSSYRKDYSGTLREVLNNWCSDFGYSFTWNIFSTQPQVIGIDLTQEVGSNKVDDIRDLVDSLGSSKADKVIVESSTESYSKEGTYKQSYISQYIKGAKTKSDTSTQYDPKLFYNVPIELVTSSSEWGGRSLSEFIDSCSIGKYSEEARASYLWGAGSAGCLTALGYSGKTDVADESKAAIIADWTEDQVHDIITNYGDNFSLSFAYYNEEQRSYWQDWDSRVANDFIGKYYFRPIMNGELDERGVITKAAFENMTTMVADGEVKPYAFRKNFEKQDVSKFPWASFIKNGSSHKLHNVFPYIRKRQITDESDPNFEKSQQGIPSGFIDPATGEIDTRYTSDSSHYESENAKYSNGIWAFEREAKWGTTETEGESFFTLLDGSSMCGKAVPKNINLEGRALMIYQEIRNRQGFEPLLHNENSPTMPVLVVGPYTGSCIQKSNKVKGGVGGFLGSRDVSQAVFARRYYYNTVPNLNEAVSSSISSLGENGGSQNTSQSRTLCESNALEEICGVCGLNDELNKPYVGFPYFGYEKEEYDASANGGDGGYVKVPLGTICEAFSVKALASNKMGVGNLKIILPCQLDFLGYLEINYNSRQTIEGVSKVFGSPLPHSDVDGRVKKLDDYKNSTLGIKLIENNITNDADSSMYDPNDDQERILNIFVPNGLTAFKDVTAEAYHKEIKKYFDANSMGVGLPKEKYSFSVAGLNFSSVTGTGTRQTETLKDYIKPEKGWSSMGISYDEKGITTSFVFETRPSVLASPQIYMKQIGPKMNVFGR